MDETLSKAVLQAIQQRLGGKSLVCGLCGGTRWQGNGIISLPIQDELSTGLVIGGKALPLIGMTCEVCGMTQFHNLIKLLGKEKFDEILRQQQEHKQGVSEAEEIIKQKGGQDGSTKETH